VDETDVGVEVNDGIVTLNGTVDSYAKKLAAERAVRRVQGVRALAEDIEINVYSGGLASDTEIATRVVDALDANLSIPKNRVKVRVENGRVTLTGSLEWQYQRARAEAVIRHLPGVTKIRNDITISQPSVSAAEIRSGIEQAFARDAGIDAARVAVAVDGTHLTLSGAVRSWAEREAAEGAAWRARGVTTVTNLIKVNP
jgi:osmotically-inducible protein OsmY